MFLLYFLSIRSRNCLEKFYRCQVCFFLGRSLFLRFFADVVSVFSVSFLLFWLFLPREKDQVVTGPPHTRLCLLSFFCCSAALVVSPVLAVRPASWRFFGVPFWAPRVFGILLEPSEALFLGTRGGRGVSCLLVLVCCFFLFCLFCGFTRLTRRPSQWLVLRQARGARRPAPRPSEGGGKPL